MQKIYTKKDDKGKTSLLGGTRLLKSEIKIQSYGEVDELNAHIGYIHSILKYINHDLKLEFEEISSNLFVIGSWLSLENTKDGEKYKMKKLIHEDITNLEKNMDKIAQNLTPLKNFILPMGNKEIASIHIARTVCRRAERSVVNLSQSENIDPLIITYLNRLSDYLFVIARYLAKYFQIDEIVWKQK
jgi:cob(I)alamin adenosyltransferase